MVLARNGRTVIGAVFTITGGDPVGAGNIQPGREVCLEFEIIVDVKALIGMFGIRKGVQRIDFIPAPPFKGHIAVYIDGPAQAVIRIVPGQIKVGIINIVIIIALSHYAAHVNAVGQTDMRVKT